MRSARGAVIGFFATFIVVAYFAFAASLVQPVDPVAALSLAMWFAPVVALCGALAGIDAP